MKALLIYLLVTSVCTGVFYGCFRLLMRKETCFAFNRATLLLIVILPLAIPFLPSPGGWSWTGATIPETTFATRLNGYSTAPPLPVANSGISRTGVPEDRGAKERPVVRDRETVARAAEIVDVPVVLVTPVGIVFWVYLFGAGVSFFIFVVGMFRLFGWLRQARPRRENGAEVIVLPGMVSAASFGKYVVISDEDYANNREEILTHEQGHRQLGHVFDLTLLTVAQIVFWFNPVIYLIKRDLREIHEYQADDYALKRGVDARKYQMLIIRKSVGLQHFALATYFNNTYCQTKKRIAMMNTMRKNGRIYWKSLVYLPVAALALMSFGMAGNSDAAGSLTVPEGWIKAGTAPENYEMGVDPSAKKDGKNVAVIQSVEAFQSGVGKFGTLMQMCLPGQYAGKRVKMTADIKSENVTGWAGMWFRVDAKNSRNSLAFDNMQDRPIKGTTGWKQCQIVLDVPADAGKLAYGVLLDGEGKVWFGNVSFEIVGDSVPLTGMDMNPNIPESPENLDFSK